jgi:hypothetical protein
MDATTTTEPTTATTVPAERPAPRPPFRRVVVFTGTPA